MLQSMGSQRVGHDCTTELEYSMCVCSIFSILFIHSSVDGDLGCSHILAM